MPLFGNEKPWLPDADRHAHGLKVSLEVALLSGVQGQSDDLALLRSAITDVASIAGRSNMVVKNIGQSMMTILPELIGRKIDEWFDLVRPLVEFRFSGVRTAHPIRSYNHRVSHNPPIISHHFTAEPLVIRPLIYNLIIIKLHHLSHFQITSYQI